MVTPPQAARCATPGCGRYLSHDAVFMVCREHVHNAYCQCDNCETKRCSFPGCASRYHVRGGVCRDHRHSEWCKCTFCASGLRVKTVSVNSTPIMSLNQEVYQARVTMPLAPWESQ